MLKDFETYSAAVSMATQASNGSGDANQFDHVAKDLHQPFFDDMYEVQSEVEKENCVVKYSVDVWRLVNERYKE